MKNLAEVLASLAALPKAAGEAKGSGHHFFFDTTENAIGQPIVYPDGTARLQVAYATLEPDDETGWHIHEYPIYILILEGTLTIDYGDRGQRSFGPGESLMEVVNVRHNGKNLGDVPVKSIAVYIGAEGLEAVIDVE